MDAETTPVATPARCAVGVPYMEHETTPECAQLDAETSSSRLISVAWCGEEAPSFHASKNPNLKPQHRSQLVSVATNDYRDDHLGALGVILNPELTLAELMRMSFMPSVKASQVLAATSLDRLPLKSLMLFASNWDKEVLRHMVSHEGLPDEVYLATYYTAKSDPKLLKRLAENPSTPELVLCRILETFVKADVVYAALVNKNTRIETLINSPSLPQHPDMYEAAAEARHDEIESWMESKGFERGLNVPLSWVQELLS